MYDEFKGNEGKSVVIHLVMRPASASTSSKVQKKKVVSATRYQSRPMQTVQCPFCKTMVQFPVGSQMIRCSSCGGVSRIQVAQNRQRKCPNTRCKIVLSYKTNMPYIRCPSCVSTIETSRWRVVVFGDSKRT